jgi:ABC-2 type transport system ATP-binding protein
MTLLKIENLRKQYPGVHALDGVSLEVKSGQIVGVLGPNMSGKTTLLKAIAGLVTPDSGSIVYPDDAKGIQRLKTFSFLPDMAEFPKYMKLPDLFNYFEDMYTDFIRETGLQLAKMLEIPTNRPLYKFSKGMKERASLAMTFARKTSLYLLDEPLGGIDPVGKTMIMEAILTAPPENASIMLSTHLVKDVENIFDSVIFVKDGKIIFTGNCEEIRESQGKTIEQVYVEMYTGGDLS